MSSVHPKHDSKRLISGYVRIQCNAISFPVDLIQIIEEFYYSQLLQFSKTYWSNEGFDFFDDRTLIRRVTSSRSSEGYRYILVDTEPVFTGQHCWRVNVKNPKRGWIVWGIAQQRHYQSGKFIHEHDGGGGYGVTYYNQFYPSNEYCVDTKAECRHFNKANCQIDIFLDADKGTMKLCVVGMIKDGEAKFHKLPLETDKGWVPYFVFGATPMTAMIMITRIDNDSYGIHIDHIFPAFP